MKEDRPDSAGPPVDVFFAIADPTRRRLLDLLAADEQPVRALAARFPVSRPAISQHLAVLRRAGLVAERRSGRQRLYRARPAALEPVHDWVVRYGGSWEQRLEALRDHLWKGQ